MSEHVYLGATFTVWFVWNLVINIYNKWVLSFTGFHFPLALTMSNKIIGWMGALIVLRSSGDTWPAISALLCSHFQRPLVQLHGLVTALNLGLNNWSLVLLSITINQLLKSVLPLPTAIISMAIEGKRYPASVWVSMAILIAGTALASAAPRAEATLPGVLLCLGSVVCAAGWTVLSSNLLQRPGAEKLDSVSLLFVSSPTSIFCLFVLMVMYEARGLGAYFGWLPDPSLAPGPRPISLHPSSVSDHDHSYIGQQPAAAFWHHTALVAPYGTANASAVLAGNSAFVSQQGRVGWHMGGLYMVVGGLLGFGYDIVHNQLLSLTSALTMAIMSNTKLVLLIGLSMLLFERQPSFLSFLGICIALLGVFWYSCFKYNEQRQKEASLSHKAAALARETAESVERAKAAKEETPLLKEKQSTC